METIVSDLDGTILRSKSSFPFYMLLAFEACGFLRFAILLLLSPVAWVFHYFVSEAAAIKLLIFVSCAGVKESVITSHAKAVLPKFYIEDVRPETWRVFSSFGKRCILTPHPRIMVDTFAVDYLGVDQVLGSELEMTKSGRATGFVKGPVLLGDVKAMMLKKTFGADLPDVGLGDRKSDYPFLALCKEGYIVPAHPKVEALPQSKLPKPVIFHDGRLVRRPTALWSLLVLIWLPIGLVLGIIRVAAGALLPMTIVYYAFRSLGVRVHVKGRLPDPIASDGKPRNILFACNHKTLLDPIFVSCALGRPVSAVTYSISRLSELISPIRTARLDRDRRKDAANIRKILQEGDLVICPEGCTTREPFVLRFSALFAELSDHIVPVAINNRMNMFYASTARGYKGWDSFFFFMNPCPVYELTFLDELPRDLTCPGGKTSYEVANYIQRVLAATLNFEPTNLTRKDKYKALTGTDGIVPPPSCDRLATKITGC